MPLALLIQEDVADAAPIREVCRRRSWDFLHVETVEKAASSLGQARPVAQFVCARVLGGEKPDFVPVSLILAASSEVGLALAAMKQGAFDYVLRPATIEEVELKVDRAVESARWLEKRIEKILGGVRNGKGTLHPIVMGEVERTLIAKVLERTNGNQVQASDLLGINRNTLHKKIKEYHLR